MGDTAKAVGDTVKDGANAVGDAVKDGAKAVGDTVKDVAKDVGDTVKDGAKAVKGAAKVIACGLDGNECSPEDQKKLDSFLGNVKTEVKKAGDMLD